MPNNFFCKVLSVSPLFFVSKVKIQGQKKLLKKWLCWEDREDSISDVTVLAGYIKLTD